MQTPTWCRQSGFADGEVRDVTDLSALLADVARYFDELSQDRPVVILLEDLHWADAASLVLLAAARPGTEWLATDASGDLSD